MGAGKIKLQAFEAKGLKYFRLAMRSKSLATFRRRILQAEKAYSNATNHYRSRRLGGAELRCRAWILLLRFFLATKASTKKRLLDESWRLTKLAMGVLRKRANDIEFANTYDQLATSVALGYDFHWNPKTRVKKLQEGIDYGRRAIALLSPVDHKQLLTRIYVRVALLLDTLGDEAFQYDLQEKLDQEALEYWRKAEQLDRQTALLQVAYPPPGFFRTLNDQEGAKVCNDALALAKEARDNFAVGWQLDQASARMFFEVFRHLDDNEKLKVAGAALKLAEEAQHRHSLANFVTPNDGVLWAVSPYTEHFKQLSWFQSDPAKRRALLEKSRSESPNLLRLAKLSGFPKVNAYARSMAGSTLATIAEWATDPAEKRRLLRESMKHRSKAAAIVTKCMPDAIEPVSLVLRGQASLKAMLADLEPDQRKKIALLRTALKDKERGVLLYSKYVENVSRGQPHILHRISGKDRLEYGDLLTQLYDVTEDERLLPTIARAYLDAAATLKQGGSTKSLGLAYWKAAEAYDLQQANTAAAEYFGLAAKTYQAIEDKNPEIVSTFRNYANYMEAWSNIERARDAHKRLAHHEAEKFYESAAVLHRTAGRWEFFAPYYDAFATLESAESLSIAGESSAAMDRFAAAAEVFRGSTALLKRNMVTFNEPQEKSSVERLITSFNEGYCQGRKLIEEARRAEDQGDHQTSGERFDEAARVFARAARITSLRREKNVLLYISTLAKAWREMARTYGTKDSAVGFHNASVLFDKSLDHTPDENAKNVSLGHKYFCEALAANDEFTHTLAPVDYQNASKLFTAASVQFARAGFILQSTHVQACKLLLDAHAEIARSSKDPDLENSAKSLAIADGILREAADAFAKSHQTSKRREVLSLLNSVNEQQGFSSHLLAVSKTLFRLSPTVAFPTPAGGEESPVGYSRLTGSHIDADYNSSTSGPQKTEVSVDLRVSNIGSESIQIVRIENILPATARLINVPPNTKVVNGSIIPVRKSTAPMNVETFKIVFDAGNGAVIVMPKVVYADDKGREKTHELSPRVITSSPLLDHLAKEFISDYREKRIATEHCGWRTLTSIGRALAVPRSHLYGDPRYGHTYGRPLETLLNSTIVECRTFPGERGRGGQILKARFAFETEIARKYLRENGLTLNESGA